MIGAIITTIDRPNIVVKSAESTKYLAPVEYKTIVVEQTEALFTSIPNTHTAKVPYDSGLSYSRNIGVKIAHEMGCDLCLIMADSICLTENLQEYIKWIVSLFETTKYDLIGLPLLNRIPWEGTLQLIPGKGFKINMLSPSPSNMVTPCDIVRNFFIARTSSLLECPWDNQLKMREHEDFFWRYKQLGFKAGFITVGEGKYIGRNPSPEYTALRDKNMTKSKVILKAKYNIADWLVR